jgi:hypothetical protein
MGVLPVPDEVRGMAEGIDRLVAAVNTQNVLLEKMLAEITAMRTDMSQMKALTDKVETMHGTVQAARDSLRMLCSTMEKKFL